MQLLKRNSGGTALAYGRAVGEIVASSGGSVDLQVLVNVEEYLLECCGLGVDVRVLEAEDVSVDLSLRLTPMDGVQLEEAKGAAETALAKCFQGNRIGRNVCLAELTHAVMDTGLVRNVIFSAPAGDVAISALQRPVPGTITVEGA